MSDQNETYVGKEFMRSIYPESILAHDLQEYWIEWEDADGEQQQSEPCATPEDAWHVAAVDLQRGLKPGGKA